MVLDPEAVQVAGEAAGVMGVAAAEEAVAAETSSLILGVAPEI